MVERPVRRTDSPRVTTFWQEHQVGGPYESVEESALALLHRDALYRDLPRLMPTRQRDKTVLDYGCGPGHDTLLFLRDGARHVYYADISLQALSTTTARLGMHGYTNATPLVLPQKLPVVDHVHCAGVLHHIEDPMRALCDMRAALKPGGEARVMVYDGELSPHTQSEVPITEWWTPNEFLQMCAEAKFVGEHVGSYSCPAEWRPDCWAACYRLT